MHIYLLVIKGKDGLPETSHFCPQINLHWLECVYFFFKVQLDCDPVLMFPKPTRMETNYLKRCFGNHLAQALAEVAMVQPSDPIEYLAHRLYHYTKTAKAKEQVHAVSLGRAVSFLIVT